LEDQYAVNIKRAIFGVCAVVGTTAYCQLLLKSWEFFSLNFRYCSENWGTDGEKIHFELFLKNRLKTNI